MITVADRKRWRPVCGGFVVRLVAWAFLLSALPVQPALSRVQTIPSCENRLANQVQAALIELGAKQVGRTSDEFELKKGVVLTVMYDEGVLASLKVSLTSEYGDNKKPGSGLTAGYPNCPVCMSRSGYEEFLRQVGQVKRLGTFSKTNPVSVVPQTGWVFKTDEYQCADVIRQERNCAEVSSDCGIIDFKVFYRLPLLGTSRSEAVTNCRR